MPASSHVPAFFMSPQRHKIYRKGLQVLVVSEHLCISVRKNFTLKTQKILRYPVELQVLILQAIIQS